MTADAEQLASLHVRVWNEAYAGLIDEQVLRDRAAEPLPARVERWRDWIGYGGTWVADRDDRLVGFAGVGPALPGDRADVPGDAVLVLTLYVVAEVYGTGIGHALFQSAVGERPAYLWVLDGNLRAITFYQRHGFRFDGAEQHDPAYGLERRMVRATASS